MFNVYLAGALSACVVFNLISGRIWLAVACTVVAALNIAGEW